MVIMRLDEETSKVMDPTKGSRRKQSKPNRVSLVDLSPPAAGGGQHRPLLTESKELDAELPQTSAQHEDMHEDDDDLDGVASEMPATHDPIDRAPPPGFACHLCGLGFGTRQSLERHECCVHLKAEAAGQQPDASGDFPTAYHRLASELLVQHSASSEDHATHAPDGGHDEEHGMMDVSTDDGGSEGGALLPAATGIFHPEAYCEICQREFCNKYFLKTHKANIHGVHDGVGASASKDASPPGHISDRTGAGAAVVATAAAAVSPIAAPVAGAVAAASAGGISKEMYSGVISSGGDICDICQKPFRNKYYIKRHKLHVHGVATAASPLAPGAAYQAAAAAAAAADAMQPSPRASLDAAGLSHSAPSAAVTAAAAAAAAVHGSLLSELVTSDTDCLVGCNMCTRKFSSMHAVKIHRASAHGVYARDLAAAAAAAAAAGSAIGVPLPVSRAGLSSSLAESAGARSERAGGDSVAVYKRGPATGGSMAAGAYLPPSAEVWSGPSTPRHGHLPFETASSGRVRGALLAQPSGAMGDAGSVPLAHVAQGHGPADGAAWPGPQSSSGNVLSTVVALSYHGPGASAAAAAMATSGAGSTDGVEGSKVSLLLPSMVPPELVSFDAKDSITEEASVNCDQCQKSFTSFHALKAHKQTSHVADKSAAFEPAHGVPDVACPAGLPFPVGFGPALRPGGSGSVNADGTVVTEYKQWRWKEHANQTRVYCDICNKELCNKYFLRTHKLKKHGISASLDSGEAAPTAVAISPYGRGGSPQVHLAYASGLSASSREPGGERANESCSNSGDAEAERFQSSERSGSSTATDVSCGEGTSPEEAGAGDTVAPKPVAPADLGSNSGGRSAAFSAAAAAAHLAIQGVKVEAGVCSSCGTEFSDFQTAMSHVCEPSNGVPLLLSDGGTVVQGSTAEEQKLTQAGSGTLPYAALLGMQKFQWKSRGGGRAAAGGPSAAAGEKLYSCSRCDYKTPWLSNIYSHEQRKHGGGSASARGSGATPFTCTVCLRTFSYEHSLMRHMADYHNSAGSGGSVIVTSTHPSGAAAALPRRHQRARCPYCSKQFVNKFLCQSHIRASHGAMAVPSAVGSGSSNGYTVMHAGATGYKLYACDRCGFKCRTLCNLRTHQVVKHAAAPMRDAAVDDDCAEPAQEPMEDASDVAASLIVVAGSGDLSVEEAGDGDLDQMTNGCLAMQSPDESAPPLAGALARRGRRSTAMDGEHQGGVIMQPFVVEAVEGGPEFALASVRLPVYRKVQGSVQVTLTLRSVDDD